MLILFAQYISFLWLFNNIHNDPEKNVIDQMKHPDQDIFGIAACTASCMKQFPQLLLQQHEELEPTLQSSKPQFEHCLEECRRASAAATIKKHIRETQENSTLSLICRDDSSLTFRVELVDETAGTEDDSLMETESAAGAVYGTIFIISIHIAKNAEEYKVFLSDDNFFTIGDLNSITLHNITVVAMHASGAYALVAKQQQYETLRSGYKPGAVQDVQLQNFYADRSSNMLLVAKIAWTPSVDMNCDYSVVSFAPEHEEYNLAPVELRNPRQHVYLLKSLEFSTVYTVGIRATNPNNSTGEGEIKWQTFTVPSCLEWYNHNLNICEPLEPVGLAVEQIFRGANQFSLKITWQASPHPPDYFVARVLDFSELGTAFVMNVSKELTTLYLPKITLIGMVFEVQLTAFARGGNATAAMTLWTQRQNIVSYEEQTVAYIPALALGIATIALAIFIIWQRRAKLRGYLRDMENLEPSVFPPERLATLSVTVADVEQTFIDVMEIDRSAITLHEVLGEGAFGLVRRGILRDAKSGPREIAVKMLKDQASVDDVAAFRREIEVMKSVGKHPHIVGIIGHCITGCTDMMLLTEYCSFGNLLDFLQDEWQYLQQRQTTSNASNTDAQTSMTCRSLGNKLERNINININCNCCSTNGNNNNNHSDIIDNTCMRHSASNNNVNRGNNTTTHLHYNHIFSNNSSSNINNNNHNQNLTNNIFKPQSVTWPRLSSRNRGNKVELNNNIIHQYNSLMNNNTTSSNNNFYSSNSNFNNNHNDLTNTNFNRRSTMEDYQHKITSKLVKAFEAITRTKATTTAMPNRSNSCNDIIPSDGADVVNTVNKKYVAVENAIYFHTNVVIDDDNSDDFCTKSFTYHIPATDGADVVNTINKRHDAVENAIYFDTNLVIDDDDNNADSPSAASLDRKPLSAFDRLDIARQVALGMEFLARNKVVHRDLAARNVLMTADRTFKIADFGLSRDIYQNNIYKKIGDGKLPIKWLALESLTHQVYTTQSDVWAYGILLYEIETLGGTPYPTIPISSLLDMLKAGFRMEKPMGCDQEFYNLMYSCWYVNPGSRPNFSGIIKTLDYLRCKAQSAPKIESTVENVSPTLTKIVYENL